MNDIPERRLKKECVLSGKLERLRVVGSRVEESQRMVTKDVTVRDGRQFASRFMLNKGLGTAYLITGETKQVTLPEKVFRYFLTLQREGEDPFEVEVSKVKYEMYKDQKYCVL